MRILHTSDWHLGKDLEGNDRSDEHRALVRELVDLADTARIDVVLIAGDVFDVAAPSAAAESIYCEALDGLAAGGKRAVVVIAGNHDGPERLRACLPLAARQGVAIFGLPRDEASAERAYEGAARVRRVAGARGVVELAVPQCEHHAVVAALPYASEDRLNELLDVAPGRSLVRAHSERVGQAYAALATRFRKDAVNLALGHLYARGGLMSDSEREIQIGGTYAVAPEHLPRGAHYVALGHLHRPQPVEGAPSPTRYAGSPLVLSSSEALTPKSVVVVDAAPGRAASIELVPVRSGRPIAVPRPLSYAEALAYAEATATRSSWVVLEIHDRVALTAQENVELRRRCRSIVQVRCVGTAEAVLAEAVETRRDQAPAELFRSYYRDRHGNDAPDGLVRTFEALLSGLSPEDVLLRAGEPDEAGA